MALPATTISTVRHFTRIVQNEPVAAVNADWSLLSPAPAPARSRPVLTPSTVPATGVHDASGHVWPETGEVITSRWSEPQTFRTAPPPATALADGSWAHSLVPARRGTTSRCLIGAVAGPLYATTAVVTCKTGGPTAPKHYLRDEDHLRHNRDFSHTHARN
jgi:hypothetical protein